MNATRVRALVTGYWADWHQPPPDALVNAPPDLVAAEFDRRRKRFVERCAADVAECDRLEAAVVAARGTTA